MFIYNSQIAISGKAYNPKPFQTKTGKDGIRFSLKFYNNKVSTFINCVSFADGKELFNLMTKGQNITVFGRISLEEYESKVSINIVADRVMFNLNTDESPALDETKASKQIAGIGNDEDLPF